MQNEVVKTHPGIAAVLSFIFNGLGQLYNGQIVKGLLIMFLSGVSMFIFLAGAIFIGQWLLAKAIFTGQLFIGIALFSLGFIFICVLGVYNIFDAYQTALKK